MARRGNKVEGTKKGHVAAATTHATINGLAPLLTAFLANPFDGGAIRNWYLALAEHCPLWALQEREYIKLAKNDRNKLVLDHAWRLMAAASSSESAHSLSRGIPIVESRVVDGKSVSTVHAPSFIADGEYLVQAYRDLLLRRVGDIPLAGALTRGNLRIPVLVREQRIEDPDDSLGMPEEAYQALEVVEELRRLVVDRDLAADAARRKAETKLTAYLRDLGILPHPKGGRPSLPNPKKFVAWLAREYAIWLPVEAQGRETRLSTKARRDLRRWRCETEPETWAARLAFPFLTAAELTYVRCRKSNPMHGPKRDQVRDHETTVRLIHGRVGQFYKKRATIADYALGTPAADLLPDMTEATPPQA